VKGFSLMGPRQNQSQILYLCRIWKSPLWPRISSWVSETREECRRCQDPPTSSLSFSFGLFSTAKGTRLKWGPYRNMRVKTLELMMTSKLLLLLSLRSDLWPELWFIILYLQEHHFIQSYRVGWYPLSPPSANCRSDPGMCPTNLPLVDGLILCHYLIFLPLDCMNPAITAEL
jgi:hypothetical protein